jgi:hypothetical protein
MNMNLTDVICTSKDGDRFWKLPTCYIRGSAIKYLRLPPDLLEKAKEQGAENNRYQGGRGRGRGGGRGRGRGGRGRGKNSCRYRFLGWLLNFGMFTCSFSFLESLGRGRGGRGRGTGRGRSGDHQRS